jgi:hypothetical protein
MSVKFNHHGREFVMTTRSDDYSGPPWKDDGGAVNVDERVHYQRAGHYPKGPGERIIHVCRTTVYVVDVRAEYERVYAEGWGLCDADAAKLAAKLERTPSRKEIAIESVERNIKRMVGWLNNDWGYVGVVVTDVLSGDSDALWRIESDDPTYILEVRDELASGLHPLADAESAAVLGEN